MADNSFDNISSRIARFQRQGKHLAAGGFHFFPARDKVRPIGAFDEHIRKNGRNQIARRRLVEQSDGIDSFERQGEFRAFLFRDERPGRPLGAPRTGIGVQGENENVAE